MEKLNELEGEPSLKFFYVLSTNAAVTAPPSSQHDDVYYLSTIRSQFSTNIKGSSGNGIPWSPDKQDSAPGFYLYTKTNNTTKNFSRTKNGIVNPHTEKWGILVGTFSQSFDKDLDFSYGTSPDMDLPLPFKGYSGSGVYEYSFKLEKEEIAEEGNLIKLVTSDNPDIFLKSYKKNFPSQREDVYKLKDNEDSYFYKVIAEEANKDGSSSSTSGWPSWGEEGNIPISTDSTTTYGEYKTFKINYILYIMYILSTRRIIWLIMRSKNLRP